ncbi:uncharacterized protein LOC113232515 [Hyposmocoma kahamanoa]|uniref:uncharacterized protein LOC113232515 n=1 Tax=Hyposmocoma kahamanoa TaxID=1477025 RepID=UPI000E6D6BB3|nr:uncharacterized protein LOC113232515 [Hyposmocoma kahamanoa]
MKTYNIPEHGQYLTATQKILLRILNTNNLFAKNILYVGLPAYAVRVFALSTSNKDTPVPGPYEPPRGKPASVSDFLEELLVSAREPLIDVERACFARKPTVGRGGPPAHARRPQQLATGHSPSQTHYYGSWPTALTPHTQTLSADDVPLVQLHTELGTDRRDDVQHTFTGSLNDVRNQHIVVETLLISVVQLELKIGHRFLQHLYGTVVDIGSHSFLDVVQPAVDVVHPRGYRRQ